MRWIPAAWFTISCSAEVAELAGLYHKIVNARHRGELVELLNNLNLLGNAAEIGVWHAGFARHNLQHWRGKRYFMIDAWQFRIAMTRAETRMNERKTGMRTISELQRMRRRLGWLPAGR